MVVDSTFVLVVIAIVGLIAVGLFFGWLVSQQTSVTAKSGLRITIAVLVTAVWIIAVVADILIVEYTISPLLHGIMGAIVGYFFTQEGLSGVRQIAEDATNSSKQQKLKEVDDDDRRRNR